jgi:bifunctional pyridoxal-dependent enzyme with beta-cystathionase and maltose regulon repressor activities
MAGICLRRGLTICSDEIYDLVFEPHQHLPIASSIRRSHGTYHTNGAEQDVQHPGLGFAFAIIETQTCASDSRWPAVTSHPNGLVAPRLALRG